MDLESSQMDRSRPNHGISGVTGGSVVSNTDSRLGVLEVVKRATRLARLRRQQMAVLIAELPGASWSKERVASLLGMQASTYGERESSPGGRASTTANVDVDTLAAIASVLGTYPGLLLLPDDDAVDAGAVVELKATSGQSLGAVSARDFGLWVLGLVPLPKQSPHYFDVSSRVALGETTAKTARGVKAEPVDPWMLEEMARATARGEERSTDFTSRNDVEVGMRVMSACRQVIRLVAMRDRIFAWSKDDSRADLDVAIEQAFTDLGDLLEELGKRQARRAPTP